MTDEHALRVQAAHDHSLADVPWNIGGLPVREPTLWVTDAELIRRSGVP